MQRQSIDLKAEGVDLEALAETFSRATADPYADAGPKSDDSDADTDDAGDTGEEQQADRSFEDEELTRLEAIETKLDDRRKRIRKRSPPAF